MLPEELHHTIPEIEVYLVESLGNSTRIDYGSGHEMSFVMFMYCLFKTSFLSLDDKAAAGGIVFERYIWIKWDFSQHVSIKFMK